MKSIQSALLMITALHLMQLAVSEHAQAKMFIADAGPFVDHPALRPLQGRTSYAWRAGVGTWGENLAQETLRLRGFNEIHEIKNGSNNGIDRVAVKRDQNGKLLDIRFVEVKTTRSSRPKLGSTRYGGLQMSRKWLAANLSQMHKSGDPSLKKLALEISRFRKASGVPIDSFAEVIHANPKTGRLDGYMADGQTLKYRQSIDRLLKNVQAKGTKQGRNLASRSLSEWDQIRSTSMSKWLGKTASQQGHRSILATSGPPISPAQVSDLRQGRTVATKQLLRRATGRVALIVALSMDAGELFDTEYAYRNGMISVRKRDVQLASTLGGMSGAIAGASAGAATGAWIGTFGGPFAWATVPAGSIAGGVIFGVGGYLGGSAVAGYGATAWYNAIDNSVKDKFETSWINAKGIGYE